MPVDFSLFLLACVGTGSWKKDLECMPPEFRRSYVRVTWRAFGEKLLGGD